MVVVLALLPLSIAAGLFAFEVALPGDLVIPLASSAILYPVLTTLVLAAIVAAAYASRDSLVLTSAWLFLFCGMLLLSLAELIELRHVSGDAWVSDLFETAAFFPLLIFAGFVAAPLRILVVGRRRTVLFGVLSLAFVLVVAALAVGPWLRAASLPQGQPLQMHLLRLLKPELDALLLVPLALLLLACGFARRARPYMFVGLGLLAMLPADVFNHYHLLTDLPIHEQLSVLFSLASQLYVLIGAILCAAGGGARSAETVAGVAEAP